MVQAGLLLKSANGYADTIVDGAQALRCLWINHSNAVVDGFSIRYGRATFPQGGNGGGGGVRLMNGTLRN